MSNLFLSRRERLLWLCAAMVVAVIYSTLGLAAILVGMVDEELLSAGFLLAMILVGVMILTQGFKNKPGGLEIGIALGFAIVYLLLFVRMAIPERSHLIEYSVVAVLVYEAMLEGLNHGRQIRLPAVIAFLITACVGTLDELIQLFLPNRVFDVIDIAFNSIAAVIAIVGVVSLRWAHGKSKSLRNN